MIDKIEELADLCKEYSAIDEETGEMTFNYQRFARLIIEDTIAVIRAGIEFGPSMEQAVYAYFGIKDDRTG